MVANFVRNWPDNCDPRWARFCAINTGLRWPLPYAYAIQFIDIDPAYPWHPKCVKAVSSQQPNQNKDPVYEGSWTDGTNNIEVTFWIVWLRDTFLSPTNFFAENRLVWQVRYPPSTDQADAFMEVPFKRGDLELPDKGVQWTSGPPKFDLISGFPLKMPGGEVSDWPACT